MRVPSSEGTLFFKATAPETVYEFALTQMLADWYPDCTPDLVAVDTVRGWMLMRDSGEQLRTPIRPTHKINVICFLFYSLTCLLYYTSSWM
jgi:hypothetical protein